TYLGNADFGLDRTDVGNAYPQYPNSSKSGFEKTFDISNISNGTKTVLVEVVSADGSVFKLSRNINKTNLTPLAYLDSPTVEEVVRNKTLKIKGWALNPQGVKEVKVSIDGNYVGSATTELDRIDVGNAYPQYPNSSKSGFEASIDISNIPKGTRKVTVEIISNDNKYQALVRNIIVRGTLLVAIDPGHENPGGDPGANFVHNRVSYIESNLNLQIAVRLKKLLEARGIEVYMTRYEGSGQIASNPTDSLKERVRIANEMKADFYVSIHHNSFSSTSKGVEVFYSSVAPGTKGILLENGKELVLSTFRTVKAAETEKVIKSRAIAQTIVNEISNKTGLYNRGATDDDYYVVKNTTMPSILIENGFISNPSEAIKVSNATHQQKVAEIVADSIEKYFQ
ncbi:N-acetylmuramoyl-L-alanine amidase, partial [Clostridium celatum]|uniref:N-acetylmuramoyl-L-alanine amidase n=1 Tax=Clostridium celatum TaxID=36834 RepID=UPI00189A5278